jgi:hypothetical protein
MSKKRQRGETERGEFFVILGKLVRIMPNNRDKWIARACHFFHQEKLLTQQPTLENHNMSVYAAEYHGII